MKTAPLVALGQAIVPFLTDLVSDTMAISSLVVNFDTQTMTLTTASAHGFPINSTQAVTVTAAGVPNPITAWAHATGFNIAITTQYPHGLSTSSPASTADHYDTVATLYGTGISSLLGDVQLVSVEDSYNFTVLPSGGSISLTNPVPSTAIQISQPDAVGLNVATARTTTTLTMPTPPMVSRSYTALSPVVKNNIRIAGAVDLAHALSHYTRINESIASVKGKTWLFVTPERHVRLSRDRTSQTDAMAELSAYTAWMQKVIDGFMIFALVPAELMSSAVPAMDQAAGPLLTAVMQTYNGRKIPHSEFAGPGQFAAVMTGHGWETYDKATYIHRYQFEALIEMTANDSVRSTLVPDLTAIDTAIQNGTSIPTGSVPPIGDVPLGSIVFTGIYIEDKPSPLDGSITLPN